jgi:hypothetical protein
MTFRLCAGISAFGDRLVLRTLDSLKGFEQVFVIEGRYTNFPMAQEYSDTSIQEAIMANYENTHLTHFTGTEPDKRSKYLMLAHSYGFSAVLILDSDEYIFGNVSEFLASAERLYNEGKSNVACVECRGYTRDHPELLEHPGQPKTIWARVIFNPGDYSYDPLRHSRILNRDGRSHELTHEENYPVADGICIVHSSAERDPVYRGRRDEYHRWLMTKEADGRK